MSTHQASRFVSSLPTVNNVRGACNGNFFFFTVTTVNIDYRKSKKNKKNLDRKKKKTRI